MKTVGGLLNRIAERGNLALAFWKAAKGHRESEAVREFGRDLDRRLHELGAGILAGTVPVGDYTRFVVFDPKKRTIHAAPFPQRVFHHALMNLCGPVLERGAIHDSYACRVGKGNAAALRRAQEFTGKHRWFLKLDIRRYFDSVDHAVLKHRYRRCFREPGLLWMLDRIVDSYRVVPDGPAVGLPIGTLTSQYFANFHLDPLDRFAKETLGCRAYVRFMDDFVLWADSEPELREWHRRLETFLREDLRLELKADWRLLPTAMGVPFLGFRVVPGGLLLGRRARRRFRARLTMLHDGLLDGWVSDGAFQRRAEALVAHTDFARCLPWRRRVVRAVEWVDR